MTTAFATSKWNAQHQHGGILDWTGHYFRSRGSLSRKAIVAALQTFAWTSLVELGCNSGPMLADLQDAFPQAHLTGVETNARAAEACGRNVPSARIVLADLMHWLPQQQPHAYDVLLTHYTLAYVSPVDFPAVIFQCRRIAPTLIFAEPMVTPEESHRGLCGDYPEWRHDYVTELFTQGIVRVQPLSVLYRPGERAAHSINQIILARDPELFPLEREE